MSRGNEKDSEMNEEFNEREFATLAQALRENRPAPEPGFTDRLDQAVADHFPPEWAVEAALGKGDRGRLGNFAERLRRRMNGRRLLLPAVAGVASVLMLATVVAIGLDNGRFSGGSGQDTGTAQSLESNPGVRSLSEPSVGAGVLEDDGAGRVGIETAPGNAAMPTGGAVAGRTSGPVPADAFARIQGGRDVAREAEITLGTDPESVQEVANEVVSVTDDHNGIVMDSKVVDGETGRAGATFSLMIPSGQIESAVAELSEIADLRSRSQELTDITAPTNRAEDAITDSEAKIKSLLGELEVTYDDDERAAIEQRIRAERLEKRWQETRLKRLERRADLTPVLLRVETGGDTVSDEGSSGWGLSDAIDDAGKLLGVAAGVTVLALAVAIPIGIVVLIALALNRAWVRRSRRRVLADD